MRTTIISHTYVTPMNQAKVQALTEFFSDVHMIVPTRVKDTLRTIQFEQMSQAKFQSTAIEAGFDFHNSTRLYHPWQLIKALKKTDSQIWLVEQEPYSLSTLQILRLKKKFGVKVLLYSFQNIFKIYSQPFSWVEKKCLSLSDGLIVGSDSASEVWQRKGYPKNKIHILPQVGVDIDFFPPMNSNIARKKLSLPPAMTFGFAGRLVEEKGVQILLQAGASLRDYLAKAKKDLPFQILIVGRGPFENELRHLIKKLSIESMVIFTGAPTHEEMPQYLQAMDVLVLPSLTRAHWREQFGHVLIEAMACEKPCLASDADPMNKIIAGSGLCFKEGDAADLALKMQLMLENPSEVEKKGKAAREEVQRKYTNQVIAEKLFQISEGLVN